MKKVLSLLSVGALALAACGDGYKKYDDTLEGCKRIETTKEHLVYKCPVDQPWVEGAKGLVPNGTFAYAGEFNLAELYADTANVYIEVAFADKFCKHLVPVRLMIAEPTADANWAFIGCK